MCDLHVLLITPGPESKHPDGLWMLPAGRLEEGETPAQGAARELREETGVDVDPTDLVLLPETFEATLTRKDGTEVAMTWEVHVVHVDARTITPICTPEANPYWVAFADLNDGRPYQQNTLQAIRLALTETLPAALTNSARLADVRRLSGCQTSTTTLVGVLNRLAMRIPCVNPCRLPALRRSAARTASRARRTSRK